MGVWGFQGWLPPWNFWSVHGEYRVQYVLEHVYPPPKELAIVLLNWYGLLCTILCVCVLLIIHGTLSLSLSHYMHPLQHQLASLSSYPRPGDGDKEAHCQCHCRAVFWLLHLTTAMVGYCWHCSYTCTCTCTCMYIECVPLLHFHCTCMRALVCYLVILNLWSEG